MGDIWLAIFVMVIIAINIKKPIVTKHTIGFRQLSASSHYLGVNWAYGVNFNTLQTLILSHSTCRWSSSWGTATHPLSPANL